MADRPRYPGKKWDGKKYVEQRATLWLVTCPDCGTVTQIVGHGRYPRDSALPQIIDGAPHVEWAFTRTKTRMCTACWLATLSLAGRYRAVYALQGEEIRKKELLDPTQWGGLRVRLCLQCDVPLGASARANRAYCSTACRKKHHRRTHALQELRQLGRVGRIYGGEGFPCPASAPDRARVLLSGVLTGMVPIIRT